MIEKLRRKLPWYLTGLILILDAGSLYFAYLSREVPNLEHYQTWEGGLIGAIPGLVFLFTGLLIAIRLPSNRYGWVLIAFAAFGTLKQFVENLGIFLYYLGGGDQGLVVLTAGLSGIFWFADIGMMAFILLLFPTGHYLSPRWRIAGWVVLICFGVGNLAGMFAPRETTFVAAVENPLGISGPIGKVAENLLFVSTFIVFACILLGAVSVVIRFIHSSGVERQQFKWIAFASVLFGFFMFADIYTTLPGLWEAVKESLVFATIPAALGIAIFRYRLYDIDLIIRKTLVYGVMTVLLVLVYFGGVALMESVISAVSTQRSPISIVISTLAIAALFNPLRRRVQEFIDRRFYRKKYDAERALEAFSRAARDEVDVDRLADTLVGMVEGTMHPTAVSLWVRDEEKEVR